MMLFSLLLGMSGGLRIRRNPWKPNLYTSYNVYYVKLFRILE